MTNNLPDFPNVPDLNEMIQQACEIIANVRGIPYDFNGTLSLDNKFTVLFKTVMEMFDAQDVLVESYKDLYNFVNTYFTNLNLQTEVNKKIDDLIENGELQKLIKPSAESETNKWLTEHITNPSNPPIDTSLTITGAAADAGIVGNKFDTQNKAVNLALESIEKVAEVTLNIDYPSIYTVDDNNNVNVVTGPSYGTFISGTTACTEGEQYLISAAQYNYKNQYSIIVANAENKAIVKLFGSEREDTSKKDFTYLLTIPKNGVKLYTQGYKVNTVKKITYINVTNEIETINNTYNPSFNKCLRSIQRIGAGLKSPMQSIDSFIEAYNMGFRVLLCDIIFTKDDVPVCWHDSYINQYYKNVYYDNGKLVSTDPPIYFSETSFNDLNAYNYAKVGYHLLKFENMVKLAKFLGIELYVEIKGMSSKQAKIACDVIKRYGMVSKTSWAGTFDNIPWIIDNIPTARVSTQPRQLTDSIIQKLISLQNGKNTVFVFGWIDTTLTADIVDKLAENNIAFEMGTPSSEEQLVEYFKQGEIYNYCTGVESQTFIAGKVMLMETLKN